jgi:cellobiose epimerase
MTGPITNANPGAMNADVSVSHSALARDLARRMEEHLFNHILPFWCGPALDREHGGWMAWLSNDLKPDRTQPKGLILNTRILWTFAAVHSARQDGLYHDMAERALEWVMNRFWDSRHGGAFWRLDESGGVVDDSKQVYGQAFCIYALAEYHLAFHSPPALSRARELFELLERHAHDPRHGGYFEARRRDWSSAGAAHVGGGELNAQKSMNTNLHVLEALTTLYRTWKEPRLATRLRELIRVFREQILDARTRHFHHYFAADWKVLSDNYTFGHDIEGSWLLCEAAEVLDDKPLLREVNAVALRMANVALNEGVSSDGGLCYEGKAGEIVNAAKEWWPQAEAVVGFINAWQLSREPKYLDAARRVWDFIERRVVDRIHGDWFWRINPDGQPDLSRPKISEWKGPYHSGRACLETMRRIETLSKP